jgi:hypothetical protein
LGSNENVLFTKRSLKTLCGKLNHEQSDDDIRKTIDVFKELEAADPVFTYMTQVDNEIMRVR